jgi:hypothetical protein
MCPCHLLQPASLQRFDGGCYRCVSNVTLPISCQGPQRFWPRCETWQCNEVPIRVCGRSDKSSYDLHKHGRRAKQADPLALAARLVHEGRSPHNGMVHWQAC